jgi:hypothetical protein
MILPDEIANTTNRVNALMSLGNVKSNRLDRSEAIAEALHISCNLLSRLADDDIFLRYEKAVDDGNRESLKIDRELTAGAVQLVSMDFGHFEGFLEHEVNLLKMSGFDDEVTSKFVEHVQHRIDHIRQNPASGIELKRVITRLQRYVCHQSEVMVRALQAEQKKKNLVLGLIGMGTISVNIMAVNALSAIGTGASASIGGALASDSFKNLVDEFWRN